MHHYMYDLMCTTPTPNPTPTATLVTLVTGAGGLRLYFCDFINLQLLQTDPCTVSLSGDIAMFPSELRCAQQLNTWGSGVAGRPLSQRGPRAAVAAHCGRGGGGGGPASAGAPELPGAWAGVVQGARPTAFTIAAQEVSSLITIARESILRETGIRSAFFSSDA